MRIADIRAAYAHESSDTVEHDTLAACCMTGCARSGGIEPGFAVHTYAPLDSFAAEVRTFCDDCHDAL